MTEPAVFETIREHIANNDVVLYMKGSKKLPQCGFSATVVAVLERAGVTDFKDINILLNQELREGIKMFSDWPTIPQLYVKGEFIGGCDIVRDMYESGELAEFLKERNVISA